MTTALDRLPPEEIGERLRIAREGAKITQATAAGALDVARTTLVAIEQGQRRVRLDEVQRLAGLYGTSVNALLRREAALLDLKPRFRKAGEHSADIEQSVEILNQLVQAELELEDLLGIERSSNDPPERPLLPGDVVAQAEQDALELRQWLGLGLSPVQDVVSMLELQLGVRVFVRRLPSKVSGLYAYVDRLGPCILLNSLHPRARRTQTAIHECGHYISTRRAPDALKEDSTDLSREERYANAFARAFLMPARTVMAKFRDITAGAAHLTRRHVIILARAFGVSRETLVRRLEELKLARAGTWDWFESNGGITKDHVRQVFDDVDEADLEQADARQPVPLRLGLMVSEVWRRELLSEGQIARLLHLDRAEVRDLVDSLGAEEGEGDAALKLPA